MSKQKQKESLSIMIAKTVLVIAILTGLGTIIFGGGVVIMKYYNGEVNNRIIKPVEQETENCAKEGESIFLMPLSKKVKRHCCEGLKKRESYVIDNNKCDVPLIDVAICIDCPNGECGIGENKCNCPEDCGDCIPYSDAYIKSVCEGKHFSCKQNMSVECRCLGICAG